MKEILIILAIIAGLLILIYNSLVGKKNRVERALSTIDTFLQKRFDLMQNLLVEAERALDHESSVYGQISKNRTGFDQLRKAYESDKGNASAIIKADRTISTMFAGMRSISENYPELAALSTVTLAMQQNITIENEINAARRQYNSNVTTYRNAIQMFPGNLLAGILGFADTYELYQADEMAKDRVKPMYENMYQAKYDKMTENIKNGTEEKED